MASVTCGLTAEEDRDQFRNPYTRIEHGTAFIFTFAHRLSCDAVNGGQFAMRTIEWTGAIAQDRDHRRRCYALMRF